MDFAFWLHMVRTGEIASSARKKFGWEEFDCNAGPIWCFWRYGPTRTPLPNGTVVCVGGEHEDSYDPDFCIYNDVIVVRPDGGIVIYGYPKEVFPPTDFHTATLYGDRLIILGGLGYQNERGGDDTPVFSLDLRTYAITRLSPAGASPGWIYDHRAKLIDCGSILRVYGGTHIRGKGKVEVHSTNKTVADLHLATLTWQPASGPAPLDGPPDAAWPKAWAPITLGGCEFEMSRFRGTVPLGHPLFAANLLPWAEARSGETLFRLLDDTERVAVVDMGCEEFKHETLPKPTTVFFDSFDAWMRVATEAAK